jgi:hypothetical protein
MKKMSPLFILLALALFPSPSFATHSWGGYHWARTNNPFTLQLGDNVSSAWELYLGDASSDWNQSDVLNTTIVSGGTTPKRCGATSGRVEVCSAGYGNTGWLGLAQIWVSGLHITKGVTKLNDTYFNTASYDTPGWRHLVVCQEVGHTFGLDHQDENFNNTNLGTCMDYTSNPLGPPTNEHPNQHDYDELDIIYQHLDSISQPPGKPHGKPSAVENGPILSGTAQWGKLIRSTNGGRTELFELDFGAGHKMYTFVIWAGGEE